MKLEYMTVGEMKTTLRTKPANGKFVIEKVDGGYIMALHINNTEPLRFVYSATHGKREAKVMSSPEKLINKAEGAGFVGWEFMVI